MREDDICFHGQVTNIHRHRGHIWPGFNAKHPWHFPRHRAGEGLSTGTRETKRHTALLSFYSTKTPLDGTDAGLYFMCFPLQEQSLSWTWGDPEVSEFGCTSLFSHFQNLNETAQKPKQDPKTTKTSAEFLSRLTELETKTTYETCFTWLGCLMS